jgi:diguanylate cyclase (GGDEF)-like protein
VAQGLYSLDGPRPLSKATKAWIAVGVVLYSVLVGYTFSIADEPLRALPAFALIHAVIAAFICGVTALLMYSHARSTGRRGYLLVSGVFLYMTVILAVFPLFFPGAVVAGEQLLGGPQSALNLYFAWHFAFPVGLSLSAWLIYSDSSGHRRPGITTAQRRTGFWVTISGIALTLWLATGAAQWLPDMIVPDGGYTPYSNLLHLGLLALCLVTVAVTAYCARNGSLIGGWLAALGFLVLGEAVVNVNTTGRYDAGWYYSRVFWLLAVGGLFVALIWNLSRIDRANSELATVDSLTGSESRMSLLDALHRETQWASQSGGQVALLWIDLDGFKGVNDQLGHPVGDEVLRQIVDRLASQVRLGDHVGRLGGDEFGVLLCDDVDLARVHLVAERLLAAVREPIRDGDNLIHVSAAIGIATAPEHATKAEDLLLCADLAMYAAKKHGGDRYEMFDSSIGTEAVQKAKLRHDLSNALHNDEFVLYYQPLFEAGGLQMAGVEVLVRWKRGDRVIAAGQFVPYAEQSGQIIPLGRTVVRLLEQDLPRWFAGRSSDFFVCLNLSVKELADRTLVEELLAGIGTRYAGRIIIEVTESLELQESSDAGESLQRLVAAGFRTAIDDFGAGFSNFTRLERLSPSLLKVDRSLVQRAGSENEGGVAFLTAATSVAASLNCDVVAEGIETESEAQVVALLGVRYVQGYRYARPGPIEEFLTESGRVTDLTH